MSSGNQSLHQWKLFPFDPEYKLISKHFKNKLKVKTTDVTFITEAILLSAHVIFTK